MKKAEELARDYAIDNKDKNCCYGDYCDDHHAEPVIETFLAGYIAALSSQTDKVQILIGALKYVCRVTYGTEFCNTDEENNEILARHFFNSADKAREALKSYDQTDEGV